MSKGLPIAQRPDLKDASLAARLDAVFGSLGPAAQPSGWSLRQDVQPFRAGGGIEEYHYSSDEEDPNEGLKPLMPSRLVDSDDEGDGVPPLEDADLNPEDDEAAEERACRERERLRASLSSRRAFEAEAEEDEYDRVATGTMDVRNHMANAKPPGFTEVPLDSAWERMHSRFQELQSQSQGDKEEQLPSDEASRGIAGQQYPGPANIIHGTSAHVAAMDTDGGVPAKAVWEGTSAAGASRKRTRGASTGGGGGGDADGASAGDVDMLPAMAEDGGADADAPADAVTDSAGGFGDVHTESAGAGGGTTAVAGEAKVEATAAAPSRRGGRRVHWADFAAASRSAAGAATPGAEGAPDDTNAGVTAAVANTGNDPDRGHHGSGRNGGGGRGGGRGGRVRLEWQRSGFVPDYVRNPHKYTMYTLDEELVVGGGERHANGRNGRNGDTSAHIGGRWRARGGGGSELEGEEDMQMALTATQQLIASGAPDPDHDPDRAETIFGSGIAFRPRTQRQTQQVQAPSAADRPTNPASSGQHEEPAAATQEEPAAAPVANAVGGVLGAQGKRSMFMEAEGGEAGGEGPAGGGEGMLGTRGGAGVRGGGRRHFRARRAADDGNEGGRAVAGGEDAMQQG